MPSHQNHNDSVHRKAIHFIYYENEAKWVSTASDKPWFIVTTSHHITCIHIHQHRYTAKPPFNQIIFVVSTPEEIGKHAMYRFSSRNFDLLPMETYAQCSLMVHQEREVKKKKKRQFIGVPQNEATFSHQNQLLCNCQRLRPVCMNLHSCKRVY